jgi:hypothetical protein
MMLMYWVDVGKMMMPIWATGSEFLPIVTRSNFWCHGVRPTIDCLDFSLCLVVSINS